MKKALSLSIKFIVFVVGLGLILVNQRTTGMINLMWMILGLAMLISLIYSYNKSFK